MNDFDLNEKKHILTNIKYYKNYQTIWKQNTIYMLF